MGKDQERKTRLEPVLQALVLCDYIYSDRESGKHVLAGTFDTIQATKTGPECAYGAVWLYLKLLDAIFPCVLQVRYVALDDGRVLLESSNLTVKNSKVRGNIERGIKVPLLPLPAYGKYALELHANEIYVGRVLVTVEERIDISGEADQ